MPARGLSVDSASYESKDEAEADEEAYEGRSRPSDDVESDSAESGKADEGRSKSSDDVEDMTHTDPRLNMVYYKRLAQLAQLAGPTSI